MNRTKVIKAIKAHREDVVPYQKDSYMDNANAAIEALEEIASEENIEMLECILKLNLDSLRGNISLGHFDNLLLSLKSIQVPKEVVYAYPVTMERHFHHYSNNWLLKSYPTGTYNYGECIVDDFGCKWQCFISSKELVDHLRENNVPIKVCE